MVHLYFVDDPTKADVRVYVVYSSEYADVDAHEANSPFRGARAYRVKRQEDADYTVCVVSHDPPIGGARKAPKWHCPKPVQWLINAYLLVDLLAIFVLTIMAVVSLLLLGSNTTAESAGPIFAGCAFAWGSFFACIWALNVSDLEK